MGARHCVLTGRVQGVGFRLFTLRVAEELGIRGWVKNLVNGDVEVRAEGGEERLERFLSRLREGPSLSSVDRMSVREVEQSGFGRFSIER